MVTLNECLVPWTNIYDSNESCYLIYYITQAGLAKAQRAGAVEAQEKHGAPNHSVGISNAKKLDEDTGSYKHKEIPSDFKKALMQGRTAKGATVVNIVRTFVWYSKPLF